MQLLAIVGAVAVIFAMPQSVTYQLFYLLFLPILWIAIRDGYPGATIGINTCQLCIILGAHFRFGDAPGAATVQL